MATRKPPIKQNELTVEEVKAESEAIFRSIGDGAIATDEFGHITRINPRALAILGLRAEEVLGKWFPRVIIIVNPDGSPLSLVERPIVRMFLTGEVVSEKALYKAIDGRLVPVSVTVSPIMFDGKPVGAVEVFRDVTTENEIDRMKSEFISLASHQLRTPLSTIQTYAHMLDEDFMGELTANQSRAVRTIIAATSSMNELIGTLLNIARIESGKIAIKSKRLDAGQIIADVAKQLQMTAESRGVVLACNKPQKAVEFQTDQLIAKEILTNLVGNAIKYTTSMGTVSISVRDRKQSVLFEIRDTGIGIPKQAQEKIFTKFFRAHNVVRQETTGTGLGLYVVKGLVTTLHGNVWFRSEEHKGTTFFVSLPKVFRAGSTVKV